MNFIDAMNARHACKAFDPNKKVSATNQTQILEFGRLSPSSFGIEPWHFLVIQDMTLREQLKPTCWNQSQVTDSAFVVVYLNYLPHNFRGDTAFLRQRLWRRSQSEERYQPMLQRVINYLAEQNTLEWTKRQSYIALSNMMTGAASLGIDSCPIEGFHSEAVKTALKDHIDWHQFDLSVIAAFGYRLHAQTPRIREPLSSVATIL